MHGQTHLFCLMKVVGLMRSLSFTLALCRLVFNMMMAKENR